MRTARDIRHSRLVTRQFGGGLTSEWASIIERAKRLDPEAFDEIVDAYSARLFGFFHRMLGRKEEAEDFVQEVFVRVVRTIKDYRDDGRFESWLFRIAGNLCRDRIRRERGAPAMEGDDALAAKDRPYSQKAGGPALGVERTELMDRLQQLLDRLPSMEREVILMRHF